jgi:DNA-directed RNA polymerase subunit RPC12/RpoP
MSIDYRNEPAFQEGKSAYSEGIRRGQNPYSASADGRNRSCSAWWAGWDEMDAETEAGEDTAIYCPNCGHELTDIECTPEYEIGIMERWQLGCPNCGYRDEGDPGKAYTLDGEDNRFDEDGNKVGG